MPIFLKGHASGRLSGGDTGTPPASALWPGEKRLPPQLCPRGGAERRCCAGSARVPALLNLHARLRCSLLRVARPRSRRRHLSPVKGGFLPEYSLRASAEVSARGCFKAAVLLGRGGAAPRGAGAVPVSSVAVLLAPLAFSVPASARCVLCPPSRFGALEAFLGPAMSHRGLVMLSVPSQGSRSVLSLLSTPPAHHRASEPQDLALSGCFLTHLATRSCFSVPPPSHLG